MAYIELLKIVCKADNKRYPMQNGISIIILSHNNPKIEFIISHLLKQTAIGDEIIIVDDHSTPDILSHLRLFQANGKIKLVLSEKNGNRSHNRNIGKKVAKNEFLIFMDGDVLLGDMALQAIRNAMNQNSSVGFVGPIHGTRYSPDAMSFYTGITNYEDLLLSASGRQQIIDNPMLSDKRERSLLKRKYRHFRWTLFFSGCCAIKKTAFEAAGEFDEGFSGWGAEDIDLGYRLIQQGEIIFVPEFHAIHIPHPRDIFQTHWQNRSNIYYMLSKYCSWEFEVLLTTQGDLSIFVHFFELIKKMRQLLLAEMENKVLSDCLFIDTFSQQNPNGNIVFYDANGYYRQYTLFGMAIPLQDHSVKTALVSQNIWVYPETVACDILREALRVAEEVYLYGVLTHTRIYWKDFDEKLLSHPAFRFAYSMRDIMEFQFHPFTEDLIQVTSMTHDLLSPVPRIPKFISENTIALFFQRHPKQNVPYSIVDCCHNSGSRLLIYDLMRKNKNFQTSHILQLSKLFCNAKQLRYEDDLTLALLNCPHPLLFLIPSAQEVPAIIEIWTLRNNHADIMCGMDGSLQDIT